jgi:hypothetical protein
MSSKIEVSRELLEVIANSSERTFAEINAAIQQARSILAAPVVERQPVYQDRYGGGWIDIDRKFYEECLSEPEEHELRILFTATPELAELQATMAELLQRVVTCGALTFDSQPDFEALEADICACLDKVKEMNK